MDLTPIAVSLVFCVFLLRPALLVRAVAMEHQVRMFRRTLRPKIRWYDRLFWRVLRRCVANWRTLCLFVQPATVTKWHREKLFRVFWRWISRVRAGRRPLDREGVALLRRMARENPAWGPARLAGELAKLGFSASVNTVKKYLGKVPPCFPDLQWVRHQLREAFPSEHAYRFLIHDNDPVFLSLAPFMRTVLGIDSHRTAFRSPWMNAVAERFVRTVRAELTDFLIPLNERHLARLVKEYADHYNEDRTHTTIDCDSPLGREVSVPSVSDRVIAVPRVRGLHHVYRRIAA